MSLRTASFALITGLAVAGGPTMAAAERAPIASVERTTAPAQASTTESNDYSKREAQSTKVADYKGGSTVVIAMSGGAFVVLLFLLLLL